jgi:hypothetical protein
MAAPVGSGFSGVYPSPSVNPQIDINSQPLAAPPRRWSTRRILWTAIPVCLGIAGLFVGSVFYFIESMMRSSGAYQMALDKASRSPCVVNAIGTPLKTGVFISGNIDLHNSDGGANLSIPVTGPRGKGDIEVEAEKANGIWRITALDFEGKDGRMQLIPEPMGATCAIVNPAYR